jgi:hypothetical protein
VTAAPAAAGTIVLFSMRRSGSRTFVTTRRRMIARAGTIALALGLPAIPAISLPVPWRELAPGLETGRFPSPRPSDVGDSTITVLRIDPGRFELRLLSAGLLGLEEVPTAPEWAERYGALAVINASMFRTDGRTSVGYMRAGTAFNNRGWSKDNALFVSQPSAAGLKAAQILDRTCQDASKLAERYGVVIQNIRMLDCERKNAWAQQKQRWSTAAVGTDAQGRVLFIHARSPWSTHDLIDILLELPLELQRLMYVEGGPEASLFAKVGGRVELSATGSFETGFWERDDNQRFWQVPNVIAVMPPRPAE